MNGLKQKHLFYPLNKIIWNRQEQKGFPVSYWDGSACDLLITAGIKHPVSISPC